MELKRTTMVITQRCTLKCKLCLAFMPYYENPVDMLFTDIEETLKRYFQLVDQVGIFSKLVVNHYFIKILQGLWSWYLHSNQVKQTVDLVTNGTIPFSGDLLKVLERNREKARVIVSDYGADLSKNMGKMIQALETRNYIHIPDSTGNGDWLFDR